MKPKDLLTTEFQCPKLDYHLALLMRSIIAKERTRYAIDYVAVACDTFTVTDGRRLFSLSRPNHPCKDGLYHLTQDGYLLGPLLNVGNFPNWKPLVGTASNMVNLGSIDLATRTSLSVILYLVNKKSNTAIDVDML